MIFNYIEELLFIRQIFIESLLCTWHCCRSKKIVVEIERTFLYATYILEGTKIISQYKINIYILFNSKNKLGLKGHRVIVCYVRGFRRGGVLEKVSSV